MKTLIFTDLDGTLLNHDNYSYDGALKALLKIKELNIPLIFTTSKTKAEVLKLQEKMGIDEPFIVENGAALFIPKNYQHLNISKLNDYENFKTLIFGLKYEEIISFYDANKVMYGMYGFSDMDVKEISRLTGLNDYDSSLSSQRDFTEPFILDDANNIDVLQKKAFKKNIKITQGGRFYHLIGKNQDKGIAVKKTIELFKDLYQEEINSIALGDGPNDIVMFENVTTPIIIKNHSDDYVKCDIKNIQRSTLKGSFGFNEMVLKNVQ
jgi:mannosyl-3-phosphoglycerate phosphatase